MWSGSRLIPPGFPTNPTRILVGIPDHICFQKPFFLHSPVQFINWHKNTIYNQQMVYWVRWIDAEAAFWCTWVDSKLLYLHQHGHLLTIFKQLSKKHGSSSNLIDSHPLPCPWTRLGDWTLVHAITDYQASLLTSNYSLHQFILRLPDALAVSVVIIF